MVLGLLFLANMDKKDRDPTFHQQIFSRAGEINFMGTKYSTNFKSIQNTRIRHNKHI